MSNANDVADAPSLGIPGQHATANSARNGRIGSARNEEASAGLIFGRFVQRGTADKTAKLLTGASNVIAGLVHYSHAFARDVETDDDSSEEGAVVKAGFDFGCAESGEYVVICADDVDPTDEVHLFHTVGTNDQLVGRCGPAAVQNKTLDISAFARWKSTALSGTPAILQFDLNGFALATADT